MFIGITGFLYSEKLGVLKNHMMVSTLTKGSAIIST